jgi:nucleoside 2-deoxyribosyltransferase
VVFLLHMLAEEQAVRIDGQAGIPNVVVLPKGYDRVTQETAATQLNQAFVAMWFDEIMMAPYEFGIEPAIREAGYQPLRIDQKEHVNKIDDEIISEIRRSRFLVADFTSEPERSRGGVYFEAGYALALGKPVIWCCRADRINEVHFDTRQFNHIVWEEATDLKVKLKNRIGAVIGDGPFRQ